MSDVVQYCQARTSSGEPCKKIPKRGDKWCAFHQKKFAQNIKHGRYADPELTGLKGKKLLTFQEFLNSEDPYNLDHEVAMLRVLLLEQREAIEKMSEVNLDEAVEKYKEIVAEDLRVEAMPEEHIPFLTEVCSRRFKELVHETYGETMIIGPSQLSVLVDTIESIAKTAERAKKIADGIVLNVSYKNVFEAMQDVTRLLGEVLISPDAKMQFIKAIEEIDIEPDEERDWIEGEIV